MECEDSNDGSKPTPIWNIKRKGANIHHQVPVFHEPLQVFRQKKVPENCRAGHGATVILLHNPQWSESKTLYLDKILLVKDKPVIRIE